MPYTVKDLEKNMNADEIAQCKDEAEAILKPLGKTLMTDEELERRVAKPSLEEGEGESSDPKELLAKEIDADPKDIKASSYDDKVYDVNGESWLVTTEDDARRRAEDDVESIIGDLGYDAFTDDFKGYILSDCLHEDALRDIMSDSNQERIDDMDEEDGGEFFSELAREMYDADILRDGDFNKNADDEIDYFSLSDNVDFDEKKEQFLDYLNDETDPISWLESLYGKPDKGLWEYLTDNGLIDEAKVVDECIEEDGVAHFVGSYDEVEHDLGDGLLAYRLD